MLLFNYSEIGERLFKLRKRKGWKQLDVAERAGISERSYAAIERGEAKPKLDTLLKICNVLQVTPDVILTADNPSEKLREEEILAELHECTPKERETALRLLKTYLQSLKQ